MTLESSISAGSLKNDPASRGPGSVTIDAVSKRFRKHTVAKRSYSTVKTTLLKRLISASRGARENCLTALHELSIHLSAGSSLGVIGRNGSGKSTLLKLIAGIYRPDSGRVTVNGRISALIELGAGFHPDFTGRENIYLGGVMFGLSRREIDQRFDAIVEYSELGDFIDDPVRTYSSGMYMRLGFSLAVHTDPDVLLVDEVLAVGDAGFINRCHDTISEFKRRGKTLIFVTHDLNSVIRWCDQAIWLDKGRVVKRGEPHFVIDSYLEEIEREREENLEKANRAATESREAKQEAPVSNEELDSSSAEPLLEEVPRWGSREVEIVSVRLLDEHEKERWLFRSEEGATVEVGYRIRAKIDDLVFGVGILRADGLTVHGSNTEIDGVEVPVPDIGDCVSGLPFPGIYRYRIERIALLDGTYFLDVAAHRKDGTPFDYHHRMYKFSITSNTHQQGVFNPPHSWEFVPGYTPVRSTAKGAVR